MNAGASHAGPAWLDVAVAGFGPEGIALACAMEDLKDSHGAEPFGTVRFFEKRPSAAWYGGPAECGADHHVFLDLVTPRNPRSRFSFPMYLKERNRLVAFGRLGRPASRIEWSDYVSWAAASLQPYASFDEPVREVLPHLSDGAIDALDVVTATASYRTRQLVLLNGGVTRIPPLFAAHLGDRVFHASEYLHRMAAALSPPAGAAWLVIGADPGAGEIVDDLLRSGAASVHVLPFTDAAASPAGAATAGYAAESRLLEAMAYEAQVGGTARMKLYPGCEALAVEAQRQQFAVLVGEHPEAAETLVVDGVVLGTGYEPLLLPPLLTMLQPWLLRAPDGGLDIAGDCEVKLRPGSRARILAAGRASGARGVSDARPLSPTAVRAGSLLDALAAAAPG